MEIASAVVNNPVAETLMLPVTNQIRYLIFCTKYVRNMRTKMGELNFTRVGVEDHMNQNIRSRVEVPDQVRGWLEEVGKINAKVESIPSDVGSCFLFITRHKLGRKAFKITEEIESAIRKHSQINWTDYPIPPGRVDSFKASTSMPSIDHHDDFESRKQTFTEALQALQPDHKSHMIALCGMGGVGKTTMMKRLKKVVQQNKMFDYVVQAVIGEKTDPIAIQDAIAYYLHIELKENTKLERADKLRECFMRNSEGGKNKFLVILDDVWELVDLEDIGLSRLPNQGVNFKVLLTSRNRHACTMMGVEPHSIFNVKVLIETEAQILFRQFVEISDPELDQIGKDIVRKCCGLPMAIKTMALNLRTKSKDAWKSSLSSLEHHDLGKVVNRVFEMSYDNMEGEDTKSVFMLCGLFPEDFNIPTEELLRYGWGLKLFKRKDTIREARDRLNTCIELLKDSNLLIGSKDVRYVKMHDLVRDFVLDMFSKVEHASLINHGSKPEWPENDMSASCKRVSFTCKNMSKFPRDLKFPNLSILKLIHGNKSLRFPENFYQEMEKVHVISYDEMKYPLLPSSIHFSPNLRVLRLHRCSLMMFDCSCIGDLSNLEVLSFSQSLIDWLPSTIGKLEKLRLLDLTDCATLVVDKGVLQNLVKLEELYMGVDGRSGKAIRLTYENYKEIAQRSANLYALEVEFFENNIQLQNMSFENLHRFKISVGCSFSSEFRESGNSFENKLQLDTNKDELLKSGTNQLFEKTNVLFLSVEDMDELGDVGVKYSFQNLRVLKVSKCAELRHLFTLGVAKTLSMLEKLEVYECKNMEEVVHTEGNGEETITFPKLKFLSLRELPKLSGLCHKKIKLPELLELDLYRIPGFTSIYSKNKLETSSLFKEEVVIPKLEKLRIHSMENLREIWPCEFGASEEIKLRVIEVMNCDNLVNLFSSNPMPFIHHLEDLVVEDCGSIEVLFDIDLDSVGETEEGSSLRSIQLKKLGKLIEVWRINGAHDPRHPICGFQAVESINIKQCKRFRKVFTPITANFDLPALMDLSIKYSEENGRNDESAESNQEQEEETEEALQVGDSMSNVVIPSCLLHSLRNLRKLVIMYIEGMEAVFEMESPQSRELATTHDDQQRILPNLEDLEIEGMESMSHVWKCNRNIYLILRKQPLESPFQNLKTIQMTECKKIKYLFSPHMAKLLSNLKKIWIYLCDGIEEVVPNRDDGDEENTVSTSTSTHTSCTTLFPRLDSLTLRGLPKLRCIGGCGNNKLSPSSSTITTPFKDSEAGGVSWSLCQYATEIFIWNCNALSSVIPWYAAGQMQKLQVLSVWDCNRMKEVFETEGMKRGCDDGGIQEEEIPRLNLLFKLPNLKKLQIWSCELLEHVFPFSALESLKQLQELRVRYCYGMKVIVKEEDGQKISSSKEEVVVFPRLKTIQLEDLPDLVGFFLGMNEFRWPSLDYVMIKKCPQMTVFARGGSTAPRLKYMHTALGKYSVEECGLNFHLHATRHQTPSSSAQGRPWSFHDLIELHLVNDAKVEKIIPSNALLQLQNLEKICVRRCSKVEEVFEAGGGNSSSSSSESQTTTTTATLVNLPNLREVELKHLDNLRYIWKSNEWTAFQFLNLTKISIYMCKSLQHVFSSSMFGSLLQLQELSIENCENMEEVIVKESNDGVEEEEEDSHAKTNQLIITFRHLKSLYLYDIPSLKGFCLGMKVDFSFPLLDNLRISSCPSITTFTEGNSTTPELREIKTGFGSFYAAGEGINSFIKTKQEEFKKGL